MSNRFDDRQFIESAFRSVESGVAPLRELLVEIIRAAVDDRPVAPQSTESGRAVTLHIPEHYEQEYAYPLFVWLHGAGGNDSELQLLMPEISDRNYIGLALSGDVDSPEVNPWQMDTSSVLSTLGDLHEAIDAVKDGWNVHPRRIYLAGFGPGATMALRLMLESPQSFAGSIMLGGSIPDMQRPLRNFRSLGRRRLLFGLGSDDSPDNVLRIQQTTRLLRNAGLEVDCHIDHSADQITASMLREINRWIMSGISSAAYC